MIKSEGGVVEQVENLKTLDDTAALALSLTGALGEEWFINLFIDGKKNSLRMSPSLDGDSSKSWYEDWIRGRNSFFPLSRFWIPEDLSKAIRSGLRGKGEKRVKEVIAENLSRMKENSWTVQGEKYLLVVDKGGEFRLKWGRILAYGTVNGEGGSEQVMVEINPPDPRGENYLREEEEFEWEALEFGYLIASSIAHMVRASTPTAWGRALSVLSKINYLVNDYMMNRRHLKVMS